MLLSPGHIKFGDSRSCCQPNLETEGMELYTKWKAMWPAETKRLRARPPTKTLIGCQVAHDACSRTDEILAGCLGASASKMAQTIGIWSTGKTRNDGKQTYSKSMVRFKLHSQMMANRIQSRFLHNAYTARGSPGGLGVGVQKIWMPTSKSILIYIHSFTH